MLVSVDSYSSSSGVSAYTTNSGASNKVSGSGSSGDSKPASNTTNTTPAAEYTPSNNTSIGSATYSKPTIVSCGSGSDSSSAGSLGVSSSSTGGVSSSSTGDNSSIIATLKAAQDNNSNTTNSNTSVDNNNSNAAATTNQNTQTYGFTDAQIDQRAEAIFQSMIAELKGATGQGAICALNNEYRYTSEQIDENNDFLGKAALPKVGVFIENFASSQVAYTGSNSTNATTPTTPTTPTAPTELSDPTISFSGPAYIYDDLPERICNDGSMAAYDPTISAWVYNSSMLQENLDANKDYFLQSYHLNSSGENLAIGIELINPITNKDSIKVTGSILQNVRNGGGVYNNMDLGADTFVEFKNGANQNINQTLLPGQTYIISTNVNNGDTIDTLANIRATNPGLQIKTFYSDAENVPTDGFVTDSNSKVLKLSTVVNHPSIAASTSGGLLNNSKCNITIDQNTNLNSDTLKNLMFRGDDEEHFTDGKNRTDNPNVYGMSYIMGNYGVTYNIDLPGIDLTKKKVLLTFRQEGNDEANLVGCFNDSWEKSITVKYNISYDLNQLFPQAYNPITHMSTDNTSINQFQLALPAGSKGDWSLTLVDR